MADEEPDMAALAAAGVPMAEAIRQCEAWKAAHQPPAEPPEPEPVLNLAAYKPPVAKPAEPEPHANTSMAMLASLSEQIRSGAPGCVTELGRDGWSEQTARELARHITAAARQNRTRRI